MKNKKRIFWSLALLFLFLLLLFPFFLWWQIYEPQESKNLPSAYTGDENIINILLLGSDQREDEPARADTIMVVSLSRTQKDISLLSIPRDSRVWISGHGLDKINHAMQFGGVALLRQTVENLLAVPLDYYMLTNFDGFAGIIDAVGGVEVDVEMQIIGLDGRPIVNAGRHKLNGRQALTYVRFRSDAGGDFGRMRRQQQVMKALFQQARQPKSFLRLPLVAKELAQHVRTDLTITELFALARFAQDCKQEIAAVRLRGEVALIDGISYVLLDETFLRTAVEQYLWRNR